MSGIVFEILKFNKFCNLISGKYFGLNRKKKKKADISNTCGFERFIKAILDHYFNTKIHLFVYII